MALDAGMVDEPLVTRYFAGHWASYVCTTMFLVGLAAMIVKAIDLVQGYRWRNLPLFDGLPNSDLPIGDATLFLQRLDKQPAGAQLGYLIARMRAALDYLLRKGSPDTLEDELRSLAELDAERKHSSYGIVRTMLWTMPFVGALGTVLGLAEAISKNVPEGTTGIPASLPPGFELILDTTVLAMLYTVSLLLVMLVADHFESRLLAAVDARASRELVGRFRSQSSLRGLQPMSPSVGPSGSSEAMVETMEKIAERQTEIWQASLELATKHWEEQTELLKKQIETSNTAGSGGVGAGGHSGGNGSGGGHGGGGAAGNGASGHGAASGMDIAGLQEALLHSTGVGSWNRIDPAHHEIMLELSEVVRQGCRNWPYRKVLRGAVGPGTGKPSAKDQDWLERS
jgi:uncharacterized membrane protein YgcG